MKKRTDRYYLASQANAKPVVYAIIGSDFALRAFGKETPSESFCNGFFYNIFEWNARVLGFGDYRESLSQNPDNIIDTVNTQEMSSYTITLDNADKFFTNLIGKGEEFIDGAFYLYQGFEYPDFEFSDFIQLVTGKIADYKLDRMTFEVIVDSSITAGIPSEDPTLPVERIYGLSDDGTGTMAEESLTYSETETFFETETWVQRFLVYRETTGVNEVLFRVTDDTWGSTRLEIGIDTNDNLYVKLTDDAATATPSYTTYTTGYTIGTGLSSVSVDFDAETGELTIEAGEETETFSTLEFTTLSSFNVGYRSELIATDDGNNIYVPDRLNNQIFKYDALGVFQFKFGSFGSGDGDLNTPYAVVVDDTGNIYVSDTNNHRIQVFDSTGTFVRKFGQLGTGDADTSYPLGLDITPGGQLYIILAEGRVVSFDIVGTFLLTFDAGEPGETPTHTLSLAITQDRAIQVGFSYTGGGVFVYNDVGDLRNLIQEDEISCVAVDLVGYTYAGVGAGFKIFDPSGTFVGEYTSPSGDIEGISVNTDRNIVIAYDTGPSTTTIATLSYTPKKFDNRNLGGNNTFTVGENVNGLVQLGGTTAADLGGDTIASETVPEISVVDGIWEEIIIEGEDTYEYDITTEFVLPTTGRYSNPGDNQKNVPLPHPYGDLTENSDYGVYVCPCIDSTNHVYCAAAWPVVPVTFGNTVSVYVDNVLQTSGYTFDDSVDYEGQGNIATITFSSEPAGVVSVSCKGRWVNSTFPTNPVDIIEDLLDYVASLGNEVWQKDIASFANGRSFCDTNGYIGAGVIIKNNSIGFHIKSILKSFMGSFSFTDEGKLKIRFLPLEYEESVVEEIYEYEGIVYNATKDLSNIVKQLLINYAASYIEVDRRYKTGSLSSYYRTQDDTYPYPTKYNGKKWEIDFDWTRNTLTVQTISDRLLAMYGIPNWTIVFQGQNFEFVPVELFDQISATLSILVDETGTPLVNKVYELRHKTINLDDFTTTITLQELQDVSLGYLVYIGAQPVYIGTSRVIIGE